MAFEVHSAVKDDVTVVAVSGEIDIVEVTRLGHALQEAQGPLVVDLRACTFMGSEGLSALLLARRHSMSRRRRLIVLVGPGGPIARLLDITGMRGVLNICEADLEAAIAAASARDRRQGPDRRSLESA